MSHFMSVSLHRPSHFNFAEDVVDYWASAHPSLLAMHWLAEDTRICRRFTFQHFSRQSHRVAQMLQDAGVRKGDRMMILLPRIPEWWELVCGAIRSGVVVIPCTTLLVDKDIEYRIHISRASVFVGDRDNVAKFNRVRGTCPMISTVLAVGSEQLAGCISYADMLGQVSENAVYPSLKTRSEEPCLIYFTSGTTGHPKMVLHSHASYPLAHTITGKHWLLLEPGRLYWNLSEQGWAKAAWSFFGSWNCGATLFVHNDRQSFSPNRMLAILNQFPITTLCAPPTVYRQLVTEASQVYMKEKPPKALHHCVGAGEPLNSEVIRIWESITGGIQIKDAYGQTETIMVCGNFSGSPIRPGSMGRPSPGVPLFVIDEKGRETLVEEEGDIGILYDSHNEAFFGLFQGYLDQNDHLNLPLLTAEDGRSWYLTGDRAKRDSDGYLWFIGRSDDVINSAGYRIGEAELLHFTILLAEKTTGPFEVESALKFHPGVLESAVVSSPDPERVEVVKAFIVLTPEFALRKDTARLIQEIQNFCKTVAAPYKYPRRIEFVELAFLPKTISGKIRRAELRAQEWRKASNTTKL